MAHVVETGAGTPNANAYCSPAFVTTYLTDLGRETENSWSTITTAEQQEAIADGTRYLERRWGRLINGVRLRTLIEGRESVGTLLFGSLPLLTETAIVGQVTYRFVDALVQENDVLRGATVATAAANLATAINSGGDALVVYLSTRQNYEAGAEVSSATLTIEADIRGASGDLIAFSTTVTGATISGSGFLADGIDEAPQPLSFPRYGLIDWGGRTVVGVPLKVRQAAAEYAVRSLAGALDPDLTTDATGALVLRKREKVGPIEEETEYAEGAVQNTWKEYPAADSLMAEFVRSGQGVIRW